MKLEMTADAMLERMREAAKLSLRKKGPQCVVCCVPAKTMSAVRQLHSEGLPLTAICAALKGDGFEIHAYSMARHFREHEGK